MIEMLSRIALRSTGLRARRNDDYVNTPTIAPIKHVVSVPDTIADTAVIQGDHLKAPDPRNRAVTNRMVSAARRAGANLS